MLKSRPSRSGESSGHLADEYLKSEQSDCLKILDWIEDQSWSNGRVGMMGIFGVGSLQVAALRSSSTQSNHHMLLNRRPLF